RLRRGPQGSAAAVGLVLSDGDLLAHPPISAQAVYRNAITGGSNALLDDRRRPRVLLHPALRDQLTVQPAQVARAKLVELHDAILPYLTVGDAKLRIVPQQPKQQARSVQLFRLVDHVGLLMLATRCPSSAILSQPLQTSRLDVPTGSLDKSVR